MRALIAKLLPFAIGILIGWLVFHPPQWLAPLGPLRYLVVIVLALVLLVALVGLMILRNLPEHIGLTPVTRELDPKAHRLVADLQAQEFDTATELLEVGVSPPAVMLGLLHRTEPIYAAVYRTGTLPAVTGIDLVSLLVDDLGGLTTSIDPRGAALPGADGSFRQSFPSAGVKDLLSHHRRALGFLGAHGLQCKQLSSGQFTPDFRMAMARQRQAFLRSPLRNTVLAILRSATNSFPAVGPLERQPRIEEEIRQTVSRGRRVR